MLLHVSVLLLYAGRADAFRLSIDFQPDCMTRPLRFVAAQLEQCVNVPCV